jgi:hypothetical protein
VRFRYALIAILAALAAIAAGAQAANADGGSSFALPEGKVTPIKAKSMPDLKNARPIKVSGTRIHNGNDNLGNALFAPVEGSVCRFPNFCSILDDNEGATLEAGEPDNCPEPSGPAFDSTVWYAFQVSRAGILDLIVDNTTPDTPTPFLASIELFNADTGNGLCGVVSDVTTNFGTTLVAGPGTTLGSTVVIGIGARLTGTAGGNYRLSLRWNPDTDGDGLVDSSDRCDSQRGPQSLRGCPDSDGDGLADVDDSCDGLPGPRSLGGCPDRDGDGVIDPSDQCPDENSSARDRLRNGCLDFATFAPDLKDVNFAYPRVFVGGRFVFNGVRITRFTIRDVPRGTKVTVKCSKRRICRTSSKRAGRKERVSFRKLRGKRLRPGQSLSLTLRKSGYITRRISWKAKRRGKKGTKKTVRCARPGGRYQRCSRVSTDR